MSWKREQYNDLKFDYVDETDFIDNSLTRRLAYTSVFIYTLKDILVYMADLGSISILVLANKDKFNTLSLSSITDPNSTFVVFTSSVENKDAMKRANDILRLFGGTGVMFLLIMLSVLSSFILLAFEWNKANKVIKSRDISFAFTSLIAYRYYAIRSYAHYCLFSQIQNSRKTVDVLAFWVFFKFKGWKRLVLAEFPRQFLNMVIIFALGLALFDTNDKRIDKTISAMFGGNVSTEAKIFLSLQAITVTIWFAAFVQLVAAGIMYIPLLCAIRGNLKEYCVHKIDKRIDEILKRKSRKRLQEARRMERERIDNTDTDNGSDVSGRRPTLPTIDVDLDSNIDASGYSRQQTFVAYPQNNSADQYSDYSSEYDARVHPQYSPYSYQAQMQQYQGQYSNVSYNPNPSYYPSQSPTRITAGSYNPSAASTNTYSHQNQQFQRRVNAGYEATDHRLSRTDSDLNSITDSEKRYF